MLTLSPEVWEEMERHAAESYPEECCGVILHKDRDELRRCRNIQNLLHERDPEVYPRDATTAYTMDFKELESIFHEAEASGATIKAFYHSHPGHEAYFSQEDKAFACPFGEPTFPGSSQVVISIYDDGIRQIKAYAWFAENEDFREIPVRRLPE